LRRIDADVGHIDYFAPREVFMKERGYEETRRDVGTFRESRE